MRINRFHIMGREDLVLRVCREHKVKCEERYSEGEAWLYITIPRNWLLHQLRSFVDDFESASEYRPN